MTDEQATIQVADVEVEMSSSAEQIASDNVETQGASGEEEQKTDGQRLMIKSMTLENFKSYAGKKVIGPFHKCFSSIVGPNGSGKSNVIDAMLFVFGKRAKKLRLNKVRELIHNSTEHPNCEYAKVTVYFHDIIDTDEGDNGYTVVPDSEFQVSRVAYQNNKSEYLVNGKKSNFSEVGKLLRKRGIDLDNNRFLILQGEVEQISLMKPKAQNPHEDGLLEYLEDIIGSNKYVEAIEEGSIKVETLSDQRGEKLNRVKLVEKEKDSLEEAKQEAEEYLKQQIRLMRTKNKLCQLNLSDAHAISEKLQEKKKILEEKLEYERNKSGTEQKRLEAIDKEFSQAQSEHKQLVEQLKKVKNEFTSFERKDIKYREDLKFAKKTIKKLEKTVKDEQAKITKHKQDETQLLASIPDHELNIKNVEKEKLHHEQLLDEIFKSFQGEAEAIRAKIEVEQAKLAPLIETTTECRTSVSETQTEIQLIEDTVANAVDQHKQLTRQLADITAKIKSGPADLKDMESQLAIAQKRLGVVQSDLAQCRRMEEDATLKLRDTRAQLESAKATLDSQSNRGTMLNSLAKASRKGGALEHATLAGRLGDLGTIDDKYDVAVSTACGALNFLVTETTKGAEKCVEYLRQKQLGRNTFVILDKLKHLEAKMNKVPKTPEDVPRLFDLVQVADAKYKTAFYYGLRDTLVAENLDQAVRIAYQGDRCVWRVVTLDGQLIDTSGTMSGGGNNVKRGGMSSKLAAAGSSPAEVEELTATVNQLQVEIQAVRDEKKHMEKEEKQLLDKIDKLEVSSSKLSLELENIKVQEAQVRERIGELSNKLQLTPANAEKLQGLKAVLEEKNAKLAEAEKKSSKVEGKIEALQQQINQLGGDQVKSQKQKAKQASDALDLANSQLNKAVAGSKSAKRAIAKAEEAVEKANAELAEKQEELLRTEADFKSIEDGAVEVARLYETAQQQDAEKRAKLDELKEEYDELKRIVNKVEKVVIDIQNELDAYADELEDNQMKIVSWTTKLEVVRQKFAETSKEFMLEPVAKVDDSASTPKDAMDAEAAETGSNDNAATSNNIDEGDKNDDDDERADDLAQRPLREYTTEELSSFNRDDLKVEISVLEEDVDRIKKNVHMGSIVEYRQREREYVARVKELDEATTLRDDARNEVENLRKKRLDDFMAGFSIITLKLKEMYQMITLGGDAELELVDSLDPFSEGIVFSVRPPKKSWKNISNLSGGEKTLSSLALVFALHHYKPTPLYVMDEIDAALDYKNVSIVANYIKERTKNAQFVIISLRNNMFELADRLVGIYKTNNSTKALAVNPAQIVEQAQKYRSLLKKHAETDTSQDAVVGEARQPLANKN